MNRKEFVKALQAKLHVTSDSALAASIGWLPANLTNWKNRTGSVRSKEAARFVASAARLTARQAIQSAIRPIFEFYPISPKASRTEKYWDILNPSEDKNAPSVRKILESHSSGVYLFYDSMGRVIYVGQTTKQTLWNEMRSAYNRTNHRSHLFLVTHPINKIEVKPAYAQHRQIRKFYPPLFDVAHYFSAYDADAALCRSLEAFMIRAIPNDLINQRIEKIKHGKR